MVVHVAVVGSDQMVNRLNKFANDKNTDEFKLLPHIYDNPEEAPYIVEKLNSNTQIVLFTGPVPYFLAKEQIQRKGFPSVYIPVNELSVLLSLHAVWEILKKRSSSISIDVPNLETVHNVYDELALDTSPLHIQEYTSDFNINNIVQHHYNLWKNNKVDYVLTSIRAVYIQLRELGVKSSRMVIPKKNIQETLQQAIVQGELEVSKRSQITAGLVSIDNFNEIVSKRGMPLNQEMILELHKILIEFGKEFNASVHHLGKDQFIIYATRGGLSQVTNNYKEMYLLSKINKSIGITVSVGFGFGTTAQEAEENAYIAIYKAKKNKGNKAYVVTDDKIIIGPLTNKSTSFSLRTTNKSTTSISEKTKISVANLSKIATFLRLRNYKVFSANDLTDYLQLSKRTAERLLKRLVDYELVKRVGTEQPYQKGRPRSIYKAEVEKWSHI